MVQSENETRQAEDDESDNKYSEREDDTNPHTTKEMKSTAEHF